MTSPQVPKAALAAFKFKLKGPKSFQLVWSNKGGTSSQKLSIWSADVEGDGRTINWKKGARARVSLGHYAVVGYDSPSAKAVRVVEITDTAAPSLTSSDFLSTVVDQLLPLPLRYRLVWQVCPR